MKKILLLSVFAFLTLNTAKAHAPFKDLLKEINLKVFGLKTYKGNNPAILEEPLDYELTTKVQLLEGTYEEVVRKAISRAGKNGALKEADQTYILYFVGLFKTQNSGQGYVLDQNNYREIIRICGLVELHGNATIDHKFTECGENEYKDDGGISKAVKDAISAGLTALGAELAIAKANGDEVSD